MKQSQIFFSSNQRTDVESSLIYQISKLIFKGGVHMSQLDKVHSITKLFHSPFPYTYVKSVTIRLNIIILTLAVAKPERKEVL